MLIGVPVPPLLLPVTLAFVVIGGSLVEGIWLTIPDSGTKCVSEEIQRDVVVLADYYIVDDDHAHLRASTISARVNLCFQFHC